jgi:hypothetical protein
MPKKGENKDGNVKNESKQTQIINHRDNKSK